MIYGETTFQTLRDYLEEFFCCSAVAECNEAPWHDDQRLNSSSIMDVWLCKTLLLNVVLVGVLKGMF